MYKLIFYVPESDLEPVKQAIFAAGAGSIGAYEHCCWQTKGQGQFRPLAGSDPAIGQHDTLTKVEEYLVEIVCPTEKITAIIAALKQAHSYETPAYQVWEILDL